MKIPKVFISYSHDSITHKKWVMDLAIRMRNNGIDSVIDQWELKPGDDLPHFMETHLADADKIIMICSENYVEKANKGVGGVGYEKMIITSNLLKNIDENKVIPVIRQLSSNSVPTFLKTKLYIDFSNNEDFEFSFDELIRTIHKSPLYEKPTIGNNPFMEVNNILMPKKHDGILQLMSAIVEVFENSRSAYVMYSSLRSTFPASRILLDFLLDEIKELGYIELDKDGDILLTNEGKRYAINQNLAN